MNDKPRVERIDPEDLRVLREVDTDLPEMEGDDWRRAWDRLFRAAHQGMCWVASLRERGGSEGKGPGGKQGSLVGYLAAQRQLFGDCVITDLRIREGQDVLEIATAMLRIVESRRRGEAVYAAVEAGDAAQVALLTELGFEPAGEVRPPEGANGMLFFAKLIAGRTERWEGPETSGQSGHPQRSEGNEAGPGEPAPERATLDGTALEGPEVATGDESGSS